MVLSTTFRLLFPDLAPSRETKCRPLALFGCRNPAYSWASCCEGTVPLSPACTTRAHPSWTWTHEEAPPPKRAGLLNAEGLCLVRCKPTVSAIPHLGRSIRTRRVLMREPSVCATPVRGLQLSASSLLPGPMKRTKFTPLYPRRSTERSEKLPDSPDVL